MHDDPVAQVDFDGGTWPLVVDANDIAFKTVRRGAYPGYVPVEDDGFGEGEVQAGEAQEEEGEEKHLAAEDAGSQERGLSMMRLEKEMRSGAL